MSRPPNPFARPGRWYRGVWHCHTTESDGAKSVEDAVAWYEEHGYDFLAITDHNGITAAPASRPAVNASASAPQGFAEQMRILGGAARSDATTLGPGQRGGLVLVPGIEVDAGRTGIGTSYHLLGIGIREMIDIPREVAARQALPAQTAVDRLRSAGAVVFAAHPYWSGLSVDDLMGLGDIAGIEVFNANCDADIAKGYSGVHWDDCLTRRRLLWAAANDDAHWRFDDYGRGWTMLRAGTLTPESVVEGLASGAFYSSTGVTLEDVAFDGDTATVRVAPPGAREVRFVCDHRWGRRVRAGGALLGEAAYTLRGPERYLRIEVVGPDGATAWTNPLFVEQ